MNINIEDYIPHRGRMRLLDGVVEIKETGAVCRSVVSDRWPAFSNGKINNLLMVELVAQSTSFCIGWKNSKNGDGVNQGWLVVIKSVIITKNDVPKDSELLIDVDFKNSFSDLYVVSEGKIFCNNDELARIVIQAVKAD